MLFSAIIVLFFTAAFLIANRKNNLYYVFGIYFVSISFVLIFASLYISKIYRYPYTFGMDYDIFLFLSKIRIPFMTLYRLYIISISLFLMAPIFLYIVFRRSSKVKMALLLIPVVIFIFINDPAFSWDLRTELYMSTGYTKQIISAFVEVQKWYNNALIYVYMLIPVIMMFKYYRSSKLKVKKKSASTFIISFAVVDMLMCIILFNSYSGALSFNNIDMTKFPTMDMTYKNYVFVMCIFVITVIAILFLIILFKPFDAYSRQRERQIMWDTTVMDNIFTFFHAQKNVYIGMKHLAEITMDNIDDNDLEKAKHNLEMIIDLSSNEKMHIERAVSSFRKIVLHMKLISLTECLNDAIKREEANENVEFELDYSALNVLLWGDSEYLTEVFVNIFNNSISAINQKGCSGKITINISVEDDFAIIKITDNGIGIKKENIKKVFTPFYSTKSKKESGGYGLTYVKRVIEAHKGYIEIDSREGIGTEIDICLPCLRNLVKNKNGEGYGKD